MADKWPVANGNWSDSANWNGGTKPVAGDDVYADGRTVTVDENIVVTSIRTTQRSGGTLGGTFSVTVPVATTRTIVASVYKGSNSHAITLSGDGTFNLTGYLEVTQGGSNTYVVSASGFSGVMNVVGNLVFATGVGPNSVHGIYCNALQADIFVTGNVYGGQGGSACGYRVAAGTNLTITGNVYAGTQTGNRAIQNDGGGTVTINGNCYASSATDAVYSAPGTLVLNGNAYGNGPYPAAITTGAMYLNGDAYSGNTGGSIQFQRLFLNKTRNTFIEFLNYQDSQLRPVYTGGQNLGQPATSDVRLNTVFGVNNELSGTCAVPPNGSVALGVPVDNTVGTAAINAASISSALADEFATTLAAIQNIEVDNEAIAEAVRTNLATELARIDATFSTRPTLAQMEASTVLAKEATVGTRAAQSSVDAIGVIVAAISAGVSQLTSRVTTSVATMWADLIQMITGSGTVNAKWTSKALENGPSGTISIPASLQQTATQVGKIIIYRGTSFSYQFLNIGDLSNWSKIYFTVRSSKISDDTKSVIQIVVTNPGAGTDGLLYLLAATAADKTFGSITVDDVPTGDVTVRLKPGATRLLTEMREVDYDIKVIKSDGSIPPLVVGTVDILLDVTRAIN